MELVDPVGYGEIPVLVGYRREFVTTDAAGGIGVFPLDRSGVGGVGVDVAAKLARQIGDRSKDAAGDDLSFDLCEPDLDLVEPGRVGGHEMKMDARMLLQKVAHRMRFVAGEIVEDDVNLLPWRAQNDDLLQEGDELAAGVAGGGFAVDGAAVRQSVNRP